MSLDAYLTTRRRGTGCSYIIQGVHDEHLDVLYALSIMDHPIENKEITLEANNLRAKEQRSNMARGTTSGRLSELLRVGAVKAEQLGNLWLWRITNRGREILETGDL